MNWYDEGYRDCPCFWGTEAASMVRYFEDIEGCSFANKIVLDLGAGEGKNSNYCAIRGASVDAVEISNAAIENSLSSFGQHDNVSWINKDAIVYCEDNVKKYDIVISYGLYHCFSSYDDVHNSVLRLQNSTKSNGVHILCAFNDRYHDMEKAHPGFEPCLISHQNYLELYADWDILFESDKDLRETHPHNGVEHTHSMTRLIARKK